MPAIAPCRPASIVIRSRSDVQRNGHGGERGCDQTVVALHWTARTSSLASFFNMSSPTRLPSLWLVDMSAAGAVASKAPSGIT
jgi:hypothetical protein